MEYACGARERIASFIVCPCKDGGVQTDFHSSTIAGWREWVSLPGIGVPWIKAKLDTGARSSPCTRSTSRSSPATTATACVSACGRGRSRSDDSVEVECPVHDRRLVRSSSGHSEERIVVLLRGRTLRAHVMAETTLSNRDQMGFRMLIGREALRQGFVVDPGESFLGGRAPRLVRRRNRGRE